MRIHSSVEVSAERVGGGVARDEFDAARGLSSRPGTCPAGDDDRGRALPAAERAYFACFSVCSYPELCASSVCAGLPCSRAATRALRELRFALNSFDAACWASKEPTRLERSAASWLCPTWIVGSTANCAEITAKISEVGAAVACPAPGACCET